MWRNVGLGILAVCIWGVILLGGAHVMTVVSGHHVVDMALEDAGGIPPLNERFIPYSADDAKEVWQVIKDAKDANGEDAKAVEAERLWLKLDLVFPLIYGGALVLIILAMLRRLGAVSHAFVPLMPVAIGVIADWVENTIHLTQFDRFVQTGEVSESLVLVAGYATVIKLVLVFLSALQVPFLPLFFQHRDDG